LKLNDIILAIDGRPILGLPDVVMALYVHPPDQVLKMDVLRGETPMSFYVPVKVYRENIDDLAEYSWSAEKAGTQAQHFCH
jgi:S1-C subfamily serine protease